jgi:hypothetical protein
MQIIFIAGLDTSFISVKPLQPVSPTTNRRQEVKASILSMALAIATNASAQAPLEFKGVPLGATEEQLLQKYPAFDCDGPKKFLRVVLSGYANNACRRPGRLSRCAGNLCRAPGIWDCAHYQQSQ